MLVLWLEKISARTLFFQLGEAMFSVTCVYLYAKKCSMYLKFVLHAMTWRITITIRNETGLDSLKILISRRQYYTDKYVGPGHVVHL